MINKPYGIYKLQLEKISNKIEEFTTLQYFNFSNDRNGSGKKGKKKIRVYPEPLSVTKAGWSLL